jgi:hypothetical protein
VDHLLLSRYAPVGVVIDDDYAVKPITLDRLNKIFAQARHR